MSTIFVINFWSALASAPTSASAGAKERNYNQEMQDLIGLIGLDDEAST